MRKQINNIFLIIGVLLLIISCSAPANSVGNNVASNQGEVSKTIYTVTFDSDGGTNINIQSVESGKTITQPTNPTKPNCRFLGWYYNNIAFDFSTPITSNITLKAKWGSLTFYTVTFDTDGGTAVLSQSVARGATVNRPSNPTKQDYNFLGWYYNNTLFNFSTAITSNITLKAKWDRISYTVTFNGYKYSDGSSITKTVKSGEKLSKPKDPTADKAIFKGWYYNGELFDFSKPITSSIILEAQWNKLWTVIFDYSDAVDPNIASGLEQKNKTVLVEDGQKVDEIHGEGLKILGVGNYSFRGWFYNNERFDFENTRILSDITIKAKFYKDDILLYYLKYMDSKDIIFKVESEGYGSSGICVTEILNPPVVNENGDYWVNLDFSTTMGTKGGIKILLGNGKRTYHYESFPIDVHKDKNASFTNYSLKEIKKSFNEYVVHIIISDIDL